MNLLLCPIPVDPQQHLLVTLVVPLPGPCLQTQVVVGALKEMQTGSFFLVNVVLVDIVLFHAPIPLHRPHIFYTTLTTT